MASSIPSVDIPPRSSASSGTLADPSPEPPQHEPPHHEAVHHEAPHNEPHRTHPPRLSLSRSRTGPRSGSHLGSPTSPHLQLMDIPQPDLSFPYQTTDVERSGFTNEYRVTTKEGFVPAPTSLTRMPSRKQTLNDVEKAKDRVKKVKFVTFQENDSEDPRNWPNWARWTVTAIVAIAVVQVAFASSAVTGDFKDIERELHVSLEVATLSVSLMVVGFGIGPLVWSPLSELYGRRLLWIVPSVLYIIFIIPTAVAKNIQTLLVCRFLCGFFGSAPLTLAGGSIADIWGPDERGMAVALFAAAPYSGPVLGPLVGGFIGDNAGWRWIMWVTMMFAGVVSIATALIPETYAPVILKRRARMLRAKTGDEELMTEQEAFGRNVQEIVVETLVRPFQMLVEEPILLLMSLYIALIYGLLYAFFFSFPIVYSTPSPAGYGFSDSITGVTFCSVFIGVALALVVTPRFEARYAEQARLKGGSADPEDRLPAMMVGSIFVPIALFIFGWTAPPYVKPGGGNWVGPLSSGIPFGFGMVTIYFAANAYLIDAFPAYVASALAAKTVVRSGAGAALPLFVGYMFHGIGNGPAASVLAGVSCLMVPIPFLFYHYGAQIRAKSSRAVNN